MTLYNVKLSHAPNPDISGGYWAPASSRALFDLVTVDSFEQASIVCMSYIESLGLGGGNWTGGQVIDCNDVVVARVSYNGRVWPV